MIISHSIQNYYKNNNSKENNMREIDTNIAIKLGEI